MGLLLLLFQNFSFIKKLPTHSLEKYLPVYGESEKIANMEVPSGYKKHIHQEIENSHRVKIFDDKKFLKDTLEKSEVYKNIEEFIDPISMTKDACSSNPIDTVNNCFAVSQDSGPIEKDASQDLKFKLRGNPMRGIASVGVSGPVDSSVKYDQNSKNLMIEFKSKLDENTNLKFEVESENREGKVKLDMSW